jgi:uroporphyrinogen-III decarboxylase
MNRVNMVNLSSRQRLLRAIDHQEVDYVPCSFMSFAILRNKHKQDLYAAALAEMEMGLDPMLFIPTLSRWQRRDHPDLRGLPVRFHPEVTTKTWREGDPHTGRLYKEYHTPAGKLTTSVRLSEDWPHGEFIPLIDDYQIPRADKPLVTSQDDLEALQYLLTPPEKADIQAFADEADAAGSFANKNGVLLAGGWGVGMDMANWLCGMENLMVLMMERPQFVSQVLDIIHHWNMRRMEAVLSAGIDLYIRRAWYEGCDFIVPKFYQGEILPRLKAEAALAHDHGARFGYICSSGTKPMLDFYNEAGIDVLIGIDPIQGTHTDMRLMKEKIGERICLWGGVSAAITVERGSEAEIRLAVRQVLNTLGPKGMILSPVDNLTVDEPATWNNIDIFIDEWKSQRKFGRWENS